jgi:repressor LexA
MQGLSDKQAQLLALIQAWMRRTGQAPSYREIAAHFGVTVRAAYQHVQALERKGVLTRTGRHRGLRLSPEHVPPAGLPIVGRVAAGTPILAVENVEGNLDIDRWLGEWTQLFALRVKGDSMIDRQIHDGDYVIVRVQPRVEHGEISVVVIDEEATVKTVLYRRNGLWLRPENQQRRYPLRHIHIARAFTCHQLATLLCERLDPLLATQQVGLVILLGPCTMFFDEHVPFKDAFLLFRRVRQKIAALHQHGPLLLMAQALDRRQTRRLAFMRDLVRAVELGIRMHTVEGRRHVQLIKSKPLSRSSPCP